MNEPNLSCFFKLKKILNTHSQSNLATKIFDWIVMRFCLIFLSLAACSSQQNKALTYPKLQVDSPELKYTPFEKEADMEACKNTTKDLNDLKEKNNLTADE